MKKLVALGFATALFALASIVPANAKDEHVVFINPGKRGEAFWELLTNSMTHAAEQLGFKLEVIWAERNRFTMQTLGVAVTARDEKPDYLVLVNEEGAALSIFEAAESAGIPTFFLLNSISKKDILALEKGGRAPKKLIGSLEPDMLDAGRRMAERLLDAASAKGLQSKDRKLHVLALAGDPVSPTSVDRTTGFLEYMSSRTDVTVDRLLYSNWNQADAIILSERYLHWAKTQNVIPAGVWAANDPIAIGAIKALEASGRKPGQDTFVVGLNWSGDAIERIKSGELLLSDGGHYFGGAWSMVILRDITQGCVPKRDQFSNVPRVYFALSAIDKSTDPELLNILSETNFSRINFRSFLSHNKTCGRYDFSSSALVRAATSSAVVEAE